MTISSETRKAGPFTGNGVTTAFPFAFKVFTTADVSVTLNVIATGIQTTLTLTSDYTVALNPDQNANPGGTVTYNPSSVPMPSTKTLTIGSVVTNTQGYQPTNSGGWLPTNAGDAWDRATILIQQLAEKVTRSLRFPIVDGALTAEVPSAALRASKLLGFDAAGNVVVVAPADQSASSLALLLAGTTGATQVGVTGSGTVQTSLDSKLPKAGGTMTGALIMSAAINEARATVAGHATAADIWGAAGNKINLTGVFTYTNFPAAPQAGANRWLYPAAGAVFTNSATFDILGSVDFTVAAGDIVYLEAITTTTFKLIPIRKNGRAVVAGIDFDGVGSATATTTWTAATARGKVNYINNAGATTQTLPLASTFSSGQALAFFNFGAGQATFARQGSDAFIGTVVATSLILNQNEAFIAISDGASWFILFLNGATGLAPRTVQDMTASRTWATNYTNSTGRDIEVHACFGHTAGTTASATVNGITFSGSSFSAASIGGVSVVFTVPKNGTYSATAASVNGIANWIELR